MNRPYTHYRDSGQAWADDIPENWEMRRLGSMGAFLKGRGGTKSDKSEIGLPCIWYGELFTEHEFRITGTSSRIPEDESGRYEPMRYGDVLFAGSDVTPRRIGISSVNLIEDRAYCGADVIIFRPAEDIDARFMGYTTNSVPSVFQKLCMGRGVTVMHIYGSGLRNLVLLLPPLDEQHAIAAFLDRRTAEVDTLIAKKRLLIERLSEYRTALIARTVTRGLPPAEAEASGLDPNPAMKDSGVEWLGEVPEHWNVVQLRRIVRLEAGEGITSDEIEEEGPYPVFGGNGIRGFTDRYTHEGEFVLIGRQGALCGNVHLACGEFFASEHAVVGTPVDAASVTWLKHLLDAMELNQYSVAAAQPGLAVDRISALRLPLPPHTEQSAIAEFLDRRTVGIDHLCARAEAAIERLQEFRTALVTAAVTGKIDVRGAVDAETEGRAA